MQAGRAINVYPSDGHNAGGTVCLLWSAVVVKDPTVCFVKWARVIAGILNKLQIPAEITFG